MNDTEFKLACDLTERTLDVDRLRAENELLRAALVRIADGCGNAPFVAHAALGNNPTLIETE